MRWFNPAWLHFPARPKPKKFDLGCLTILRTDYTLTETPAVDNLQPSGLYQEVAGGHAPGQVVELLSWLVKTIFFA